VKHNFRLEHFDENKPKQSKKTKMLVLFLAAKVLGRH
jgi:hypothetical protein